MRTLTESLNESLQLNEGFDWSSIGILALAAAGVGVIIGTVRGIRNHRKMMKAIQPDLDKIQEMYSEMEQKYGKEKVDQIKQSIGEETEHLAGKPFTDEMVQEMTDVIFKYIPKAYAQEFADCIIRIKTTCELTK